MTTTMNTTVTNPAAATSDRRALWILLAATTLMLVVHLLPTPAPLERNNELIALTPDGKTCLAILLFAVTLWVGEAMPFAATSLLVLILIPAFGITDFASAVNAGFGSPLIVFFIGVLFLSTGFTFSGLGTRMVLHVLRLAGTRTDRVLLGFLIAGALLSMWITDMAVAAILLPLGVGVLKDADLKPLESNFGRALMISCAYGPLIGGIGTPAGTAANLIALSYLEELAGLTVSFGEWMALGVPAATLMIPLGWWLLLRIFPPEIESLPLDRSQIDTKLAALGPLRAVERKTIAIFGLTITLWLITPWLAEVTGGRVDPPIQAVALLGGLALFLPTVRVMTWKEAQANMDWGGVMLIVAGLSLGLMVFETGAARWLAQLLLGNLIVIPPVLRPFVIVIAVSLLHLLFSSNTVTGSLIMPILLALALDLGLDAWTIAAPAAFTSTLAFILVTESPTNVLPYSAGYFSIRDMAKVGILMTLAAAVCVTVSITVVQLFTG